MSDPHRPPPAAAAAGTHEFTDLWRTVSKLCPGVRQDQTPGPGPDQMPGANTSPLRPDLQSPKRRVSGRFCGLNNGDSPGDMEPSQDIFWDPTSPTPAHSGSGQRNRRVVEISDIVNRIAPKDVKQKGIESPLLQWIGDSAVSCTPDLPKPRLRKKSTRQSSVDDLLKLARQFDENMQQDRETSEQPDTINNNNNNVSTSTTKVTETSLPCNVTEQQCPSSLDKAEAELHALFDCSTQKVSRGLSQGSSTCSQPATSASTAPQQPEHRLAEEPVPDAKSAEVKPANKCDDFDDDWENDDLLNDPLVLALTQNPDPELITSYLQSNAKTTKSTAVCKTPANANPAHEPSYLHSKPSCSVLQELCPKPKTTNRSTFKLGPNTDFQTIAKKDSSPRSNISDTVRTPSTPQPVVRDQKETCAATDSGKDNLDSLWDDGDDDALLFQVCDSVERLSNSQPQHVSPNYCQGKQDKAADAKQKQTTTAPLPIDGTRTTRTGAGANRQAPACTFVRSNSLPGTSCGAVNYQGWNVPMRGANNQSGMSQSLPGSRVSPGTFSHCGDFAGSFQAGNANLGSKPHTVTAGAPQSSRSHHTAFKRNVSDSAVIGNKVFVTSQMTGKCSAAEIEKKKQEALARRRLRLQNNQKT